MEKMLLVRSDILLTALRRVVTGEAIGTYELKNLIGFIDSLKKEIDEQFHL
jgi:hypothetical protein